ncbi:MAG TPA: hypothetical protein VN180_05215 [Acidimicrobiia bacterium]|jgi:hypothetical protein|nr:hypothetical protein [Acidimicrobiia bacterium]
MDSPNERRAPVGSRPEGEAARSTPSPTNAIVDDAMALQAQMRAEQTLLESGTPGRATITGVTDLGVLVQFNPQVVVDLTVAVGGAPPYDVRLTTTVPPTHLAQLEAGADLDVRVDPAQPQHVAIDWSDT